MVVHLFTMPSISMTEDPFLGVVNGPLKMRSLGKFCPSLGISLNLVMGLGVSEFVSVGHIYAFPSSH